MTTKEKAIAYCMQQLEQLQLSHIYNHKEFERCFKGCNQLNPFSVGLSIADHLINFYHFQITNNNDTRI
jgi:DNA/RNA endonuclease G (NUC1)